MDALHTILIVAGLLAGKTDLPPDTVVVCPPAFRAALEPWLDHRRGQGHQAVVIDNKGTAEEIQASIRREAAGGALRFVVLVGDAVRGAADPALAVPTFHPPAQVNIHWGLEKDIASDNGYADLDDDGLPDLAVGGGAAPPPPPTAQQVAAKKTK